MSLCEALSVGTHNKRYVAIGRSGKSNKLLQVNLARGHPHKIISSHNLGNALQFVIYHHGKVVGRNTIIASQHHVVNGASTVTENTINEANVFA